MRYIISHATNAHWEGGAIPDRELVDRVGVMIGDLVKDGVFVAAEGLGPSSGGVRLRFRGGARTVIPGPLAGENELASGFTIVRVTSLDDAIAWATREAAICGDCDFDIRPVHEPWDIGLATKPAGDPTRRYMILRKATPATEAGDTLARETESRLAALIEETTRQGVHLTTVAMKPSRKGRRYVNSDSGVTFFDGPFAESKELLGGFVMVTAGSFEEACSRVPPYITAVGAHQVDLRELA